MRFLFTEKSGNQKTGVMPVVLSPKSTCGNCPLKKTGCYARMGFINMWWDKVSKEEVGISWEDLISKISALPEKTLWRFNQAGDFVGKGDNINLKCLKQLVKANRGKTVISYTHKTNVKNWRKIEYANKNGFTINLSADNEKEADSFVALGVAPVVVVTKKTENFTTAAGNKVVICPSQRFKGLTCKTCQLCAKADRKTIIGFIAHGRGKDLIEC